MKTPVLVLPGNSPIALTVIRSLGRKNIPVYSVFPQRELNNVFYHVVKASRYITKKFYFDDNDIPEERAKALIKIGEELKQKAVLIPVTDKDMIIISEYRNYLSKFYYLNMPDHEILKKLLKKNEFPRLANKYNLPIPKTFSINSMDELRKASEEIRYPCIIKPDWRQEKWHKHFGREKVVFANSREELLQCYSKIEDSECEILLQEVIDGKEDNILCSFTYLDNNSNPLDIFVCRKIRQSPPYFGNTALAESVFDPEVIEETKRIYSALNLVGYVSVEFKKDAFDNKLKIIEVTPGRINRQAGIAGRSGVDIPFIWYNYLTGNSYQRNGQYEINVKWLSEVLDLNSLPVYLKNKDLTIFKWIKSFKNVKAFEVFSKDDLRPILLLLPVSISYYLKNKIFKTAKNKAALKLSVEK